MGCFTFDIWSPLLRQFSVPLTLFSIFYLGLSFTLWGSFFFGVQSPLLRHSSGPVSLHLFSIFYPYFMGCFTFDIWSPLLRQFSVPLTLFSIFYLGLSFTLWGSFFFDVQSLLWRHSSGPGSLPLFSIFYLYFIFPLWGCFTFYVWSPCCGYFFVCVPQSLTLYIIFHLCLIFPLWGCISLFVPPIPLSRHPMSVFLLAHFIHSCLAVLGFASNPFRCTSYSISRLFIVHYSQYYFFALYGFFLLYNVYCSIVYIYC